MSPVGKLPAQPQVSASAPTNEEPLPPLDPELGVLALEWAPDLAEILRRYDPDWDKDMIEFAFSYWSAEIEKVKARQGDRIACRMNGLFKVPETADSIWEVANVVRTQNKGRNAYLLLLRFERDSVFEEVVTKNPDLQRTDDAIWIGFTKSRRDSYIILDDWFRKKKDIKAVDPRVYRQWLDTREEIEPEPKPKSRNTSVPTTPLSGASMVNHHPSITFDSFKKAEELGKQAAQLDGDTGTPASGRRKRNSVIEAEQRMQLQAQHKELSKKLRQEMQQQKSEAKNKKKIAVVVEPSAPTSETPVALPKAPEAVADTPVETPPRKKRGRPPKSATSAKHKKEEAPSPGHAEKETAGATEPKTPVSVKQGGIPEVPESASSSSSSSSSLPPPSTPSGSDEEGSVRRHSRRRRGHMDAAEAYRLAACQGLVDTNPYDKWAHDAAEAQQTRIALQEAAELEQIRLQKEQESEAEQAAMAVETKGNDEEEDREAREKEIEEKRKELKEKQQEKARLKAEIKAHRKEQQERIVEQVLQMEHDKAAALDGVAAGGTKSDSVRRDAASGIIRIRAKPSPVPSATMPTSLPEGEVPAEEGSSSSSSSSSTARPGEMLAQAAEEAVREVQELSPSPSEAPTPSMSSGFHGDDEEPEDEVMESEASVGDEGSDYEEDDTVTVGRRTRAVKRSAPAAAGTATTSKSKRRRGALVTVGSKRRSSVSSPSGNADEPKSPGGLFSPGGDGATSTVNPRKLYREKATEGFRKLFEAGDVADDEESKEERCRKWATELEAALFITTGGKNGESGWQKYLDAMKRLVPIIKDTQSKEKHRHLKREGDDDQASPLLTRPIGVTGLLLRSRLSVDQLASKHCTSEWLQEMIGWDDLLLEDPTSDNRVKPIQGLRGILFRECLDPTKGVIHPGKRSAMQCHLWSYALEHEMHASSNDAASYRQAIGALVRKLRELESNSLPAFRLLHTNKITCKRLASTSAATIVSENAPHRTSSAASSGGSTPGGGSSPKAASPAECSAAAVVLSRTAPTAQSTEPDLYDDLAVDAGVPKLPTSGSEPTSVSLKRVASALITAEEELQESAPDFAPAPMIMMEDDESDDDEEESVDEDDHDGDRARDPGHSPPPVVSEGTWVAL